MRIIFLTITYDPEPGALRGLPLARWLKARGYDIKVLTTFPQYPIGKIYPGYTMRPWQWDTIDDIPILRVPIYPSHDTSALRRMGTYLSFMLSASTIGASLIGEADIVYLYEPPPTNGLASLLLKYFRGTPIVHHIADIWPETVLASGMVRNKFFYNVANTLIGRWCRFLYHEARVVTVLSPGMKQLLIQRGVPAKKIKVIYNWADEDVFRPVEYDTALADDLGFTGRFNIVYAGNIGPLQDLETVVRAATLLKESHPKIQIVIMGTGPKEMEVKGLAASLHATNVRFIPRREYWEMPKINRIADVLLIHLKDLPFLHSTIPSKVQVSMASGRPVLIGARGDPSDLIQQGQAGLLCEPENPADMARAMIEMEEMTPEQLTQMGESGRRYYLDQMSLDSAGEQMDAIFRLIQAKRGHAHRVRRVNVRK